MECLVEWAVWVVWAEWECNTVPVQNTLRTRVKQIRNPQKEISGGFFITEYNQLYLLLLGETEDKKIICKKYFC